MTKQQLINEAAEIGIKLPVSWTKKQMITKLEQHHTSAQQVIDHHEKHSNSYHWNPQTSASQRRREEQQKTFEVVIGDHRFDSSVSVSCRNYYYRGTFTHCGEKVTLRTWRKMADKLKEMTS